jgi:hypothetical protein
MVVDEVNWIQVLTKSENKSRGSGTGLGLRLSSIDGWTSEKLPKLLIVWTFDKISSDMFPSITRPGRFSKKRDISAVVKGYELFLIDSEKYIVPWTEVPRHSDLVLLAWTKELIAELKNKSSKLNKSYPERPISFQLSFKNGKYLRLQYKVKNYKKLPPCPFNIKELLNSHLYKLIGTEFKLKKDHSEAGGPSGWFSNEIAKWENENRVKKSGNLFVKFPNDEWELISDFKEGKQDYWTGFAIDHLMSRITPGFSDQGGHITGSDHEINLYDLQYINDEEQKIDASSKINMSRERRKRKSSFSWFRRK